MKNSKKRKAVQRKRPEGAVNFELVEAVEYGDTKWVVKLLDEGANPNIRNERGDPVLYAAIANNCEEIAIALIGRGAVPFARNSDGEGILSIAIESRNVNIVKMLLDAGVPPKENWHRRSSVLTGTLKDGDRAMFNLLLDHGADVNESDALMFAVSKNDEQLVELLLSKGAKVNTRTRELDDEDMILHHFSFGDTPLHVAVRKGNPKIVKMLLDKKARPDATNDDDETPYDLAMKLGKKEVIEIFEEHVLRNGEDYSKKGNSGFRPIKITDANFSSVVGLDNVKAALNRDMLFPLKNPDLAKEYGVVVKGGILLYGPPGCGKTFITKALAGEAKTNIIEVKISDVVSEWAGRHEKNMRRIFERARKSAPCIVFFDEIEYLGGRRDMNERESWMRGGLNVFLAELDGLQSKNKGVLVVGATNAPWMIDSALKRSGRVGKWIYVPPPDEEMRVSLFKNYLAGAPLAEGIDYKLLAKETKMCTSSDIAYLCEEGVKMAWQRTVSTGEKSSVTMEDLIGCIKKEKYNLGEWYEQAKGMLASESNRRLYSELSDAISVYDAGITSVASQTYR